MRNMKPARRMAYRYGQQWAALTSNDQRDDADRIAMAFLGFIKQFEGEDDTVVREWLMNEFSLGKRGSDPLSGFVVNSDSTITKMYSLT